jgi:hypothetical protein
MTLADYALSAVFALNGAAYFAIVALAVSQRHDATLRAPGLRRWVESHRHHTHATAADAAAYPPGSLTPSARHRDEMIRQGLFG